jgi:hypothetical protein
MLSRDRTPTQDGGRRRATGAGVLRRSTPRRGVPKGVLPRERLPEHRRQGSGSGFFGVPSGFWSSPQAPGEQSATDAADPLTAGPAGSRVGALAVPEAAPILSLRCSLPPPRASHAWHSCPSPGHKALGPLDSHNPGAGRRRLRGPDSLHGTLTRPGHDAAAGRAGSRSLPGFRVFRGRVTMDVWLVGGLCVCVGVLALVLVLALALSLPAKQCPECDEPLPRGGPCPRCAGRRRRPDGGSDATPGARRGPRPRSAGGDSPSESVKARGHSGPPMSSGGHGGDPFRAHNTAGSLARLGDKDVSRGRS